MNLRCAFSHRVLPERAPLGIIGGLGGAVLTVLLAQHPAAQQAAPGSVEGVAVRAGSLEPLAKTVVELRQEDPAFGPRAVPALLQTTTTQSDGRFQFRNLAPGRYQIVAARPGFARGPIAVTVAAGQAAQNVQIAMTVASALSGRVTGENGEPLGNIIVRALRASYRNGRRELTAVQSARTNDLGEYRFFWLTPARYFVSAIHPFALTGPEAMETLGGGSIMASGPNGVRVSRATADPAHTHRLGGPRTEHYVPVFYPGTPDQRAATGIDLAAGSDVGGIDLTVSRVSPRRLSGTVINAATGQTAEYPRVTVDDGQAGLFAGGPDDEPEVDASTRTFNVRALPGPHLLMGTAGSGIGYLPIEVGDRDLDNLTIVATPEFSLSGRVSSDGQDQGPLGVLQISLVRDLPILLRPNSYSQPRPDGSFVVSATQGTYRVNVVPILNLAAMPQAPALPRALADAYVKSIRMGSADVLNGGLRVDGPSADPIEIVIGTRPGALAGVVGTERQQAAGSVTVVLVPDVRSRNDLYRAATTDGAGRFQIERVPPGDYRVLAWEDVSDGAWYDPDFLRSFENRATPVRIAEGTEERVTLIAVPAQ